MTDTILVRYGEIALKGKNRIFFEQQLAENIKNCLKSNGIKYESVERSYGRILVKCSAKTDVLKKVFGIISFSHATKIPADLEQIKQKSLEIAKEKLTKDRSFKITAQRLDKTMPFSSMELNKSVGEYIFETLDARVDLKNPDVDIGMELIDKATYIFSETTEGFGGLPLGSEAPSIALIDDEKSLLAAWLMMKRGSPLILVGLEEQDCDLLKKYSYGSRLEFRKIKDITEMDRIAKENNILAACVGQTLKEFKELETELVVFRPLLTYSEQEIKEMLERIR